MRVPDTGVRASAPASREPGGERAAHEDAEDLEHDPVLEERHARGDAVGERGVGRGRGGRDAAERVARRGGEGARCSEAPPRDDEGEEEEYAERDAAPAGIGVGTCSGAVHGVGFAFGFGFSSGSLSDCHSVIEPS